MTTIQKSAFYIFVSLLLIFVYPLDLYFPSGNQCIYFFWGIKDTGFGFLENDFLATQPDPFPLFSLLVTCSSKLFGNHIFLFWYWLMNLIYVVAFFELMDEMRRAARWQTPSPLGRVGEVFLFLFFNSTLIWGFFFSHFFNLDLRWAWDSGFAEQGILRGYFQPSVFGVFILLSVALFVKRKFLLAFVSASISACFHANYLLVSAVFIGVYLLVLLKEKNYKVAVAGSLISLLIVLPYLIYTYRNFGSSSPETVDYIRNHIKGHIHFDYHVWVNTEALLQFMLITCSLWLMRKTVLFIPLLTTFVILVALSLLTYISGSIFLLNLTPWRISVVLVPVSVAIVTLFISQSNNRLIKNFIFAFVLTSIVSAIWFRIFGNNSAEYIFYWRVFTLVVFIVLLLIQVFAVKYFNVNSLSNVKSAVAVLLLFLLGLSGIFIHAKDRTSEDELIKYVMENRKAKPKIIKNVNNICNIFIF